VTWPETMLLAVALAMDAFAVSLAAGASGRAKGIRATFRLAFHFGLFQFLMPVIGWALGLTMANAVEAVDHWIAFVLLAFIGGRMIREALNHDDEAFSYDPSRGLSLILLSIATSVDALAVGLSLAMLKTRVLLPSLVIGVIAGLFSVIGHRFGGRLGRQFGIRMELAGGALLILIGVRIVFVHLTG
jgi:manganese efflux pump family protein